MVAGAEPSDVDGAQRVDVLSAALSFLQMIKSSASAQTDTCARGWGQVEMRRRVVGHLLGAGGGDASALVRPLGEHGAGRNGGHEGDEESCDGLHDGLLG